jgi:hypothetical protein
MFGRRGRRQSIAKAVGRMTSRRASLNTGLLS